MSGLICERVVRPTVDGVSFGPGLVGNLVLLDLLKAVGVPCILLLVKKKKYYELTHCLLPF